MTHPLSDQQLFLVFAREGSDEAFAAIVERHARWIFAAAFRQLGDCHLAEDATQTVFVLLAQRSQAMSANQKISGWLFNTLGYTVKNLQRQRRRRLLHERQAAQERAASSQSPARIDELALHLDAAVANLSPVDRQVILLRFYQDRSFEEIADALGISAVAARKRLSRGTEKLRKYFERAGMGIAPDAAVSAAALVGLDHVPLTLTQSVLRVPLSAKAGAAIPASLLTTTKGTAFLMAATKIKILAALVLICIIAIPATVVAVRWGPSLFAQPVAPASTAINATPIDVGNPQEAWRVENVNSDMVARLGPEVQILPTKFPNSENFIAVPARPPSENVVGIHVPVTLIAWVAYHVSPGRIVFADGAPTQRYDFIASTLDHSSPAALQQELLARVGLVGHRETREMDVLELKSENPNAVGLAPTTTSTDFFISMHDGIARIKSVQNFRGLAFVLEQYLKQPVNDQTGMAENFSIDFSWKEPQDPNHDSLKQALRDQLGLELVPGRESVEVLVLEKATQ